MGKLGQGGAGVALSPPTAARRPALPCRPPQPGGPKTHRRTSPQWEGDDILAAEEILKLILVPSTVPSAGIKVHIAPGNRKHFPRHPARGNPHRRRVGEPVRFGVNPSPHNGIKSAETDALEELCKSNKTGRQAVRTPASQPPPETVGIVRGGLTCGKLPRCSD
ncbi:hypothetical protein CB1_000548002 [Camelus ferus]|nr:hypothetical protein CB1_000548002 [Camelus ferus]